MEGAHGPLITAAEPSKLALEIERARLARLTPSAIFPMARQCQVVWKAPGSVTASGAFLLSETPPPPASEATRRAWHTFLRSLRLFRGATLYGLGDLEAVALEVLRLVIRQTGRGENLDADLFERAKVVVERYDKALMLGHKAPGVVPFRECL
jgi:hypothetical protein